MPNLQSSLDTNWIRCQSSIGFWFIELSSRFRSRVGLTQSSEYIAYQQKLKLFVQALGGAQQQSTTSEAGEIVTGGNGQYQQYLITARLILDTPNDSLVEIQGPNKSIVTFTKLGPNNWKVSPIAGFPKAKSWSDLEMMENMEGKTMNVRADLMQQLIVI